MRLDGLDRISFRFSRGEVAALLQLMNLPGLPGVALQPADPAPAVEASLMESGVAMPLGEFTYVDATVSAILREACGARWVAVRSARGEASLCRGSAMCVVIQAGEELVSLEPLPDLSAAREAFLRAARQLGDRWTLSADGADRGMGDRAALDALLQQLEGDEV